MPQAIPIIISAAAAAATAAPVGAGLLGTALFTVGTLTVTVGTIVGGVLSIAAAVVGTLLNRAPDAGKQSIEATVPRVDAKPPKRIGVGRFKFGGRRVHTATTERDLYASYLVASHHFAIGEWTLFIDDREVETWEGDPFDMAVGATVISPEVMEETTFWISGGGHTQAPQAFIDAGVIDIADRWDDLTMVWVKSGGVSAKDFNKAYPRGPDRELQLLCDGGIWLDPATQIPAYTATPAVIAYTLMQDDLGLGYEAEDLTTQSFADSAIIEQQPVPLAAGGTHPRYEMNGTIDLTSDRGDFIAAIQNCAASNIVLQGGKWAYLPGVAQQSVMTLNRSHLAGPESIVLAGESDARYNTVEGSFIDPTLYTPATNPLYQDEAALAIDGVLRLAQPQHPHVTQPVQAQRLDHISLRSSRLQRTLSAPFTGRAIFLTEGDVITTSFELPFWVDGPAIVRNAKLQVSDRDGTPIEVNMLELQEYDPTTFEWAVVDEQPYIGPTPAIRFIERHEVPTISDVGFSGSGPTRSVEIRASGPKEASSIEWEYTLNDGADWITLQALNYEGAFSFALFTLRQESLPSGAVVRWRLRVAGGEKLTSDWYETSDYTVPGAQPLPEPSGVVASSTAMSVAIDWSIPDDDRIDTLEIYRLMNGGGEPDPLQGSRVALLPVSHDTTETYDNTGLVAGTYRYWARCYGGELSGGWSVPVDHTTT